MSTTKNKTERFSYEKKRFNKLPEIILDQQEVDLSDNTTKDRIQSRLFSMISYAISRHDWYELQRDKFLNIGIGILGASVTASGVAITVQDKIPNKVLIPLLLGLGTLLITSMVLILKITYFTEQDHPYRKVADIRSWYFKYNIKDELPPKISKNKSIAQLQVSKVIDAYQTFIERWIEYAKNQNKTIEEDIQQVFILQLLQHYRSNDLKKLKNITAAGISISICLLTYTAIIYSTTQ